MIQKVLKENEGKNMPFTQVLKGYDLISLKYGWPGMRRFIEVYIRK